MKRFKKINIIVISLTILLLVACGPQNPVQESQEPMVETATTIPIPTKTQVPTLALTSTISVPTPVPPISLEPVTSAAYVQIDSWSPDNLWLASWLWMPENMAPGIAPPGKLVFFNSQTDEICEFPDLVISENYPEIFWQADGHAVVFHTNRYWGGLPCQDLDPVNVNEIELAEAPEEIRSPNGTFRAETVFRGSDGGFDRLTTIIRNDATGQEMNRVNWEIDTRLGSWTEYLGGNWVTDDLFLIHETRNQGPLLIQAGGEIVQVAPDLFDVPAPTTPQDSYDWVSLRAVGSSVDNEDLYHILLIGVGNEELFPKVLLFHSDSDEVETLPYKHLWNPGLSPDGQWVLLDSRPDIDGYESNAYYLRSADPSGSQMRLFAEGSSWSAWSPDQSEIVFGWTGEFIVFQFPSGDALNTWRTGEYSSNQFVWSPNGHFLATSGNIPGKPGAALFVAAIGENSEDN